MSHSKLNIQERVFFQELSKYGIERPHKEYQFHPKRKWRFDYCLPSYKIAIEVEGGVWINGRHTRGKGFINDMEKYNNAVVLGYRLLRITPDQLNSKELIKMILEIKKATNGVVA